MLEQLPEIRRGRTIRATYMMPSKPLVSQPSRYLQDISAGIITSISDTG